MARNARMNIERGKPDSSWISFLTLASEDNVSEYLCEAREDEELRHSIRCSAPREGRQNFVQIAAPYELYTITRIIRPAHVVEVGVSAGVSSAYFLRALHRNGRGILHSIDLPEVQTAREYCESRGVSWALPPGKDTGWAVPSELKAGWDLRLGSSEDILPSLVNELSGIDIFLYDIPHTRDSAISDFKLADRLLGKGSVVCVDNGQEVIEWWADRRNAVAAKRNGSGLRGFSVP